jgi:hypothetical protein
MGKKEVTKKDLQIESAVVQYGDISSTISLIKIPVDNRTNKAFRIFNEKKEPVIYKSTRLGTLEKNDEGLQAEVTGIEKEIAGRTYELCEVSTKEVLLSGKIVAKAAAAEKIVNLSSSSKAI